MKTSILRKMLIAWSRDDLSVMETKWAILAWSFRLHTVMRRSDSRYKGLLESTDHKPIRIIDNVRYRIPSNLDVFSIVQKMISALSGAGLPLSNRKHAAAGTIIRNEERVPLKSVQGWSPTCPRVHPDLRSYCWTYQDVYKHKILTSEHLADSLLYMQPDR